MLKEKQLQFAAEQAEFWYTRIFVDQEQMLSCFYDRNRKMIRFHFLQGLTTADKTNLSWSREAGLEYCSVDTGEASALTHCSPINSSTKELDTTAFLKHFSIVAQNIDPAVFEFVKSKVKDN